MKHQSTLKFVTLLLAGTLISACSLPKESVEIDTQEADTINLENNDAKAAYAIGASAGKSMRQNLMRLDDTSIVVNKDILLQGYIDGLQSTLKLDNKTMQTVMNEFRERVNDVMQAKQKIEAKEQAKIAEENLLIGAAFLAKNKIVEGVVTLESGLQYKALSEGKGIAPTAADRVKVHYKGTLIDGTQFDSSYDRGEPSSFGVSRVIKGWTEALLLMKPGAKWQLVIPAELAYGATSRPNIPGNSVLLFDVELLEIVQPEQ